MNGSLNIEVLQDLLEKYCREHLHVAHGFDDKKAFFRLEAQDQFAQAKLVAPNVVIVGALTGRRIGEIDEQKIRWELILRFASYASKVIPFDRASNQAIRTAEVILLDFLTRMHKDQEEDPCGPLRNVRLDMAVWDPIEEQPWHINHFGWDLYLPIDGYMPPYNPVNWLINNGD